MKKSRRCCVAPDGRARFPCPRCRQVVEIEVEGEVGSSTPLRTLARCPCGEVCTVYLQRRAIRRKIAAAGRAGRVGRRLRRPVVVRDISRSGLCFEHRGGTRYRVGERLEVEFELIDPARHRFQAVVRVRRTTDTAVGAEFIQVGQERAFAKALLTPTVFRELPPPLRASLA